MRAIVTGGAGFIGSHLAEALLERAWEVVVVDDFSGGFYHVRGARTVEARVQDAHIPALDYDAIFHLAGKVGPLGVLKHTGLIASDTIEAASQAGIWAQVNGCPLIDVSTSEVYGDPSGPNAETTVRQFQPGSSARMEYAISKLAAETMLLNRGMDVRIVRPFNVTGPRQLPDGGFVLPRFVAQALANEPLTVYAPGTQRRAFTHVADIVEGIIAVYERGRRGEAYNLGKAANECSITELADAVLDAAGTRAGRWWLVDPVTLHGPAFREAPDKIPDAGKARRELGWEPRWERSAIVQDVVGYWRREKAA